MIRRHRRPKRTYTLFPYTTLSRSFNPALAPSEDNIADDIRTAIKGLFKPVIAWLREGTVERRGIELAQAQSPGAWDLPPDEMRRGAGETRVISRFLRNLAVEDRKSTRLNSSH